MDWWPCGSSSISKMLRTPSAMPICVSRGVLECRGDCRRNDFATDPGSVLFFLIIWPEAYQEAIRSVISHDAGLVTD